MGDSENTRSHGAAQPYDPLRSLQLVRPDLLGFIFHLSWLFLLFYSSALSAGSPTPGMESTDIVYVASTLALTAVLLLGCLRTRTFMRLSESRAGVVAAPVATSLGTLLYCLQQSMPSLALVWVAGVLTGAGSAVMAARWASVFGNVSSRVIIANFPTILVVIVAICVSIDYLPLPLCLALLVALPLCSGAALQFARRYQHARRNADEARSPKPNDVRRSRYGLLAAFVALIGFTAAVLPSFEVAGANYGMLFYLISAVLVLGFVGTAIFLTDRPAFPLLFAVPLLVLLGVLLPFVQYSVSTPGDALYPVGNIAIELLLLFGTVLFALVTNQSPARMFMVGRAAMAVGDLAGAFLGAHLATLGNATIAMQLASVCLFASTELLLAALVVSYFVNRRRKPQEEGFAAGAGAEAPEAEMSLGEREAAGAGAGVGAPEAEARLDEREAAGAGAGTGARPNATDARTPEAEPAHTSAQSEEAKTVEALALSRAERLNEVALRFGLSERERDVLELLAEGRSSARIQEDLCISAGTVNYHTRNIYAKLGVHSRQEVIDLVCKRR